MSPPQPPIRVEASPSAMRMNGSVGWICTRRANGASFCQVDKISPVVRLSPCSTSGSHECIGAKPTFSAKAKIIMVVGNG